MDAETFKPSPKYLAKLRIQISIIAACFLLGAFFLALLLIFGEGIGAGLITFFIIFALDLLWWIPAMVLAGPYYRSLRYEIHEDEIILHVGIWTKSVKHVPYRTVTNLTVNRGILDRWLSLGTLDIQTAGASGTTSAEQSLVGLANPQEVYERVVAELRRFRGGMAPTAAEEEPVVSESHAVLDAILSEVQAIRTMLEKET